VADLISAKTDLARAAAARQLAGGLRNAAEAVRQRLIDALARLEAEVDFPEDASSGPGRPLVRTAMVEAGEQLKALLEGAHTGELLRRGLRVALVGRPNTGKSSLLNALLGRDRAIVDDEPGTTRDWIEETLLVGGFPIVLVDTAGLRDAGGAVEREGVARSQAQAREADLRLWVLDSAEGMTAADAVAREALGQGPCWAVWNKADRCPAPSVGLQNCTRILSLSALQGVGVDGLRQDLFGFALQGGQAGMLDSLLVTQPRQHEALRWALAALDQAQKACEGGAAAELVCIDLRESLDCLGELTGTTARVEVLEAIFSRFCIGK